MALKIRLKMPKGKHPVSTLVLRIALGTIAFCAVVFLGFSIYYYFKYQGIVDARLKEPLFEDTAKIFAAPREVRPGQKFSVHLIANELRQAGYTADGASETSQLGTFSEGVQAITVRPGQNHSTRRTRRQFISAAEWFVPSATNAASRCRATSWSHC